MIKKKHQKATKFYNDETKKRVLEKSRLKYLEKQRANYALVKTANKFWVCSYCKKKKHSSNFNKKYRCKTCHTKQVRQHRSENLERYRMLQKMRVYGLTETEYKALSKKCECCSSIKNLGIDHNHKTGEVRGILCTTCNTALACLKDNPKLIIKLSKYINKKPD